VCVLFFWTSSFLLFYQSLPPRLVESLPPSRGVARVGHGAVEVLPIVRKGPRGGSDVGLGHLRAELDASDAVEAELHEVDPVFVSAHESNTRPAYALTEVGELGVEPSRIGHNEEVTIPSLLLVKSVAFTKLLREGLVVDVVEEPIGVADDSGPLADTRTSDVPRDF